MTSKQETFTVWMKSLVCHSNGCTVFNSNGEIIYRVENYDNKCNKEVYLMDLRGKVLFTIRRRKCALAFGRWDGYRWSSTGSLNKEKPWFQVKIYYCRFLMGNLACQVTVARDRYWILKKSARKPAFRIVMNNINGDIVAKVNQKQSSSGISFGEDVLTLRVEPHVDHSFIVALVTVYGLINRRL
ncbi:hypothetical protein AB3S75_024973 [Citrus x aurantiifolia]